MRRNILYKDLLFKYDNNNSIPYYNLLTTIEWGRKRLEILERDNFKCQICGMYETNQSKEQEDGSYLYSAIMILEDKEDKRGRVIKQKHDKKIWLDVHHKFYIVNKLPWEYANDDLITYCGYCHEEWHKNNQVKYYSLKMNSDLIEQKAVTCSKCSGLGYIPEYHYYKDGICFDCHGERFKIMQKL